MFRGIYVLLVYLDCCVTVEVGALGTVDFKKGLYAYVGSAQRHLGNRVARHLEKTKRRFWHIDYLLSNDCARIVGVYSCTATKPLECVTAKRLGAAGGPIKHFGCSDCRCDSHLIRIDNREVLEDLILDSGFVEDARLALRLEKSIEA